MAKCRICKENQETWAWQPFGPGDNRKSFTLPGSHYRGFPVIKICDSCKRSYEVGNAQVFTYQYQLFRITGELIERYNGETWETVRQ